ncbi:MAG: hypothetical protein JWM27_3807 [Gemmatimonadetes bacterium]|jgi:hypothetical protein|nr:hypothetical protein [Gemmatimonadota bacterium]
MATFDYRRKLTLKETLPALGAAVGAAAGVFYLARIVMQRTPLVPSREIVPGSGIPPQPQPAPKVGRPRT